MSMNDENFAVKTSVKVSALDNNESSPTIKLSPNSCLADDETAVPNTENVEAVNNYKSGTKLWIEAWIAEESLFAQKAQENFNVANQMFHQASLLEPANKDYSKFAQITNLKVEGNQAFNDAVKLQTQANETREKYLFQEARNKFQKASEKFYHAYSSSGDSRFDECKKLTDRNIDKINKAIKKLHLNTGLDD